MQLHSKIFSDGGRSGGKKIKPLLNVSPWANMHLFWRVLGSVCVCCVWGENASVTHLWSVFELANRRTSHFTHGAVGERQKQAGDDFQKINNR